MSNQLSILIPLLPANSKQNNWLEQLNAFLSKTKLTVQFILTGDTSALEGNKVFRELSEKGRLKTAAGWQEAAAVSDGEYLLNIPVSQLGHLGNITSWFSSHKKNIQEKEFYLADASPKKGDKNKGEGNLSVSFFRFLSKLFTSVQVKGAENGIWLAARSTAADVLGRLSGVHKRSTYEAADKAALAGYRLASFPIQAAINKEVFPGVLSPFRLFFSTRWYWFVKQPLADLKQNKLSSVIDGSNTSVYRLLFFALSVVILIMLPALSGDYGVTWDEPEDNNYFVKVFHYFTSFGEDKSCLDNSHKLNEHLVNYGPFVNLVCISVYELLNNFFDVGLYETRHFVIALFGVIGMIYTGLLARRISNSWKTGFVALLFIFTTPFIFGHSMNNQKDIPFMAFYAVSLYYMVGFVSRLPRPDFRTSFFLTLSMGITMSIRIGGLLVFAYLALFAGLYWLRQVKNEGFGKAMKMVPRYLWACLPVLIFAYVVGIIFWPYAIQDPVHNPLKALGNFEKFSLVQIFEIFDGERYHMKGFPWYYLPKSILVTAPLFVLAGIALFGAGVFNFLKKMDWRIIAILVFITVFPLVYVIYKKSAVYSSWRHLYFIYPGMIVMAAMGWSWLSSLVNKPWFRWTITAVIAVLVIKPVLWSVKNHPYQYVYYNEITGGVKGAYGKYETDYWCQSPREAIEWLMKNEGLDKKKAFVVSNNESHSMSYYTEKVNKDIIIGWAREQEWHNQDWDYAIWTTRTVSPTQLKNGYFPPKGTIHEIKVDGIPLAAIVKKENNYLYQANQYMDKRNYDSAFFFLDKAVKYDSLDEEGWRLMGLAYLSVNQRDKAVTAFNKAIELRPENPSCYLYMAYIDAEAQKPEEAIAKAKMCIKYRVNYSQAYELIGNIYVNTQKYAEAITWFKKELDWNGNADGAYNGLGKAYLGMKNINEALKNFDIAVRINPNSFEANMGMAECLKAKGDNANAAQFEQRAMQLMGGRR